MATPPVTAARPRHVQFVRALGTGERQELVRRFRERNGPTWSLDEEIDPFLGFVRNAKNAAAKSNVAAAAPLSEAGAALAARAFVKKNADLLGVPPSILLSLADTTRRASSTDSLVRLEATFPTKGYQGFAELDNEIAIDLIVEDDGTIASFVNASELHPRLQIDTKPGLPEDDPHLYDKLLGRRLFASTDDGAGDVRIELGVVERDDVIGAKLVIAMVPGPMLAYITYRLAWLVSVAKAPPRDMPALAGFYFFNWLVDTDSADVVRDTPVPTRTTVFD